MEPENIPTEIVENDNEDIFDFLSCYINTLYETYTKCIIALINLLIFIAKKECIKLHHKAFHADCISRSTKIRAVLKFAHLALREF